MCLGPAAPANNASGFVNARISVPRDGWTPSPPVRASAAPPIPSCAHPRPRYGVRAASWARPGNWPGPLRIGWNAPSRSAPYPVADPVLAAPRRLANRRRPPCNVLPHPRPFQVAFSVTGPTWSPGSRAPPAVRRAGADRLASLPFRHPPSFSSCLSRPPWSPGCSAPPSVRRAGVDCARALLSLQSAGSAGPRTLLPRPAHRPALLVLVPGVVQVVAPSSTSPRLELLSDRLRPGGILQPFLYLRTEIGLPFHSAQRQSKGPTEQSI